MAIDGNAITVLTWNAADTTAGMATFKGALSGSNISIFFSGTSGAVLATGSLSGDKNSVSGSYDSGSEQGNWSGTICQ